MVPCLLLPFVPFFAQEEGSGEFFRDQVLPVLEARCFECHGAGEQLRGGLWLTRREGLLGGGDSGPAVDLADPLASLILRKTSYANEFSQMPPAGPLPEEERKLLVEWVRRGIPWPEDVVIKESSREERGRLVKGDGLEGWALLPLEAVTVPAAGDGREHPIDSFVLERLAARGLDLLPEADRRTLLRRLSYDLTGLPPSLEEVQEFERDRSPRAYENLVERLLASPHYGERWGRHWLDLVRYAETNGFERDGDKPEIWRYRDWVIRALNEDLPYDQFVRLQLAGDELDPLNEDALIATGFLRLSQWDDEPAQGKVQARYDTLDDVVRATAEAFLATSMGCARCHDHVGDPISTKDYYSFMAFFEGLTDQETGGTLAALFSAEEERAFQEALREHEGRLAEAHERGASKEEIEKLEGARPRPAREAYVAEESGADPPQMFVQVRGNALARGAPVEPAFPRCMDARAPKIERPSPRSSGRRSALARWITSPENGLMARAIVNRVWQQHFGVGIAPSANDFGELGERPSHPQLLDWLAGWFVREGYSLKKLHRLILTSRAYRQGSSMEPLARTRVEEQDPSNQLLAGFRLRRLSAEELRDSLLLITDRLNGRMGGPSIYCPVPAEVLATASRPEEAWGESPREEQCRRSVYIKVKRSLVPPDLATFDFADTDAPCAARFTTVQPQQALFMLNGERALEAAAALAHRVQAASADGDLVQALFERALQRAPRAEERMEFAEFARVLREEAGLGETEALVQLALLVLNLNEFHYID